MIAKSYHGKSNSGRISDDEGAALEVFYAHPRCLGEHRGAVNTYQHGEFARALPELQKRKEGKKR